MFSSLVNYIKEIIHRKSLNNPEEGITISEISDELITLSGLSHNISNQEILKALNSHNNGIPIFEKFNRGDGVITWRLSQNIDFQNNNFLYNSDKLTLIKDYPSNLLNEEDFKKELEKLKNYKKNLIKQNEQLKLSLYLLQNPNILEDSLAKLENSVLTARDTYSMIDEKINNLLNYLNF